MSKKILGALGALFITVLGGVITAAIIREGELFQSSVPTIEPPIITAVEPSPDVPQNKGQPESENFLTEETSQSNQLVPVEITLFSALLCIIGPIFSGAISGAVVGVILGYSTDAFDIMDGVLMIPGGIVGGIGGIAAGLFLGDFLATSAFSVIGTALWGAIWGLICGAAMAVVIYRRIVSLRKYGYWR